MNTDRLFALYDRVADAPDAVGRLRRFVLDLAVRGKLVEQDPADEPASELLRRIAAAKARLVRIGNIRKPKPSTSINRTEVPFEVPIHWTWIRLGDIGTLAGGMTPSKNRPEYWDGDVTWLSPKDIKADAVSDSELKITKKALSNTRLKLFPVGSLFMVARSGILKRTFPVTINRVPAASNQDLKVLVPFLKGQERYLQVMFRGLTSFILKDLVKTGTTVQSLKYAEFEVQPIPLPPLAEQHRIVAKVDDLMALCDRLEEARTVREDTRDRLTKASLTRLSAADTDVPTFRSHARFAVDALPALTARADQVKHLRQTILNLAVRGKLVEQDPADEPASELLKRIAAEKARMVKAGEIRKPKRMPVLDTDELPFCLPHKWAWTRLFEMSRKIHYGFTASANRMVEAVRLLRITDIQDNRVDWLSVPGCEIEENVLPKFRLERGDVLIARTGGTVGKSFLVQDVPVTAVFASYLIRIQGSHEVNDRYLKLFLESPTYWTQLRDGARGAGQPNVNGQTLGRIAVPVPPLAEQLRIVTKVDQLMALCDRLEDGLSAVDGTRNGLLESLLHESLGSHEAMINGMIGGVARVGT